KLSPPLQKDKLQQSADYYLYLSLKLNLLKGTVGQIKLEAAGIVLRTLASCPCWFESASATSAGLAVSLLIKQREAG
ncbi:hypothetical protein JOQ06_023600, partial [Pogonophryne albipinna]